MNCNDFTDRDFKPRVPGNHDDYVWRERSLMDLDDPQYDWEYYGDGEKYGRYAVDHRQRIKRGLTMGEFYGTGVVD